MKKILPSERILLNDPDFISIDGAEIKYGVTSEELCILITNKKLPAYMLASSSSMIKAARLSKSVHRYSKITEISWSGNCVENGKALMMDEAENLIIPNIVTRLHGSLSKLILIKPSDLKSLVNDTGVNDTGIAKKRKTTMDEFKVPAYSKYVEAFNAVVGKKEKPTNIRVLMELQNMGHDDEELFVTLKGKLEDRTFEYREEVIGYSTYKHWLTMLKKQY